jgi:hypothetical protein
MVGKFGLRMYLVNDPEGFSMCNLHSTAWKEVRLEAQRIARVGVWNTDTEFIPPSQIRCLLVTKL